MSVEEISNSEPSIFLRRPTPAYKKIQWLEEPTLHFTITNEQGVVKYYNSRVSPFRTAFEYPSPEDQAPRHEDLVDVLGELAPLVRSTLQFHNQPDRREYVQIIVRPTTDFGDERLHLEAQRYERQLEEQRENTFQFLQQFKRLHSGSLVPALLAIRTPADLPLIPNLTTFRGDSPRTPKVALEYRKAILRSRDLLLRESGTPRVRR